MSKKEIKRGEENTTLTISLSKSLRGRIEEAAAEDRRKVSPWVVIQLEKVLDEIERENAAPMLRVAEDEGGKTYSPSSHAGSAGVKYPRKKA